MYSPLVYATIVGFVDKSSHTLNAINRDPHIATAHIESRTSPDAIICRKTVIACALAFFHQIPLGCMRQQSFSLAINICTDDCLRGDGEEFKGMRNRFLCSSFSLQKTYWTYWNNCLVEHSNLALDSSAVLYFNPAPPSVTGWRKVTSSNDRENQSTYTSKTFSDAPIYKSTTAVFQSTWRVLRLLPAIEWMSIRKTTTDRIE